MRLDRTGQRYGMWVCIEPRPKGKWLCRCDCGTVREVAQRNLVSGGSKCCGCQSKNYTYSPKIGRPMKYHGCNEDCFNCKYEDCYKPDYMCKSIPEVTAW